MYIPAENFAMEAYSEVYLDVDSQAEVYSDQYSDDIEALRPAVEDKLAELADGRYDDIVVPGSFGTRRGEG